MTQIFSDMPTAGYQPAKNTPAANTELKSEAKNAANVTVPAEVKPVAAYKINGTPEKDTVEITEKEAEPKKKKSPVRAVKDFIQSIKMFFTSIGVYGKAAFKAAGRAIAAASVLFTGGEIANGISKKCAEGLAKQVKLAQENGLAEKGIDVTEKLAELAKKRIKISPKAARIAQEGGNVVARKVPNKVLAALGAALMIGVTFWNASLENSEKKSEIYHRWTGHDSKSA